MTPRRGKHRRGWVWCSARYTDGREPDGDLSAGEHFVSQRNLLQWRHVSSPDQSIHGRRVPAVGEKSLAAVHCIIHTEVTRQSDQQVTGNLD